MSLDLDKCIYPNCLIKLTAYKKGYEKIHLIRDFKAPNRLLSLRLKGSGCHYNSIYNNTGTK
jgi:hypothetical protein